MQRRQPASYRRCRCTGRCAGPRARSTFSAPSSRTPSRRPGAGALRKDNATKEAVVAAIPSHQFVHLATHGFFAGESESSSRQAELQRAALQRGDLRLLAGVAGRHPGLLSGLVFAGVNRSDRRPEETILTALEAAELELGQVELVVLSACSTGRGQVAGGEGVLGLQRAFQLAGARSVVASLWQVPDEETHQLMREFYSHVWSKTPVLRAEALRQAQLWMLENWSGRSGVERLGGPKVLLLRTSGPPSSCRGTGGERHRVILGGLKTGCPVVGLAGSVRATSLVSGVNHETK